MGAGLGSEAPAFETEGALTLQLLKPNYLNDLSPKRVLGSVRAFSNNDTGTCLLLSMLVQTPQGQAGSGAAEEL